MGDKRTAPRMERRRSARADASLSMRVEGRPQDGELTQIVTESQNISASGVYCTSPHYLAPLSKVALTIVLPSRARRAGLGGPQRLLKCDGVVVRCLPVDGGARRNAFELACSFIALNPGHRELLEDFVIWRGLEALTPLTDGKATARKSAKRGTAARAKPKRAVRKSAARRTRAASGARSTRARRAGGR